MRPETMAEIEDATRKYDEFRESMEETVEKVRGEVMKMRK